MSGMVVMENASDTFQLPNYPIECYRSGHWKYQEPSPLHWHFCCEMIVMHRGEERAQIGENSVLLKPGDVIYIHPRQVHEFVSTSPSGTELTLLKFDTGLLFSAESYEAEQRYLCPFLPESGYRYLIFRGIAEEIAPELACIVREMEKRTFGFELRMRNHIGLLMSQLADRIFSYPVQAFSLSTREQEQFNHLLQYLSDHFYEEGLLQKALDICNLSYSSFAAKFKSMFGKSFTEYLSHIRMAHARQRLLNSDDSVSQIAEACGYGDAGYFTRMFRKATGTAPLAYRKQAKAEQTRTGKSGTGTENSLRQ